MCAILDCVSCPCMLWAGVAAIAVYFLREYMQGGKFTKSTNETGKVVIVTGANGGIGKETSLELARRGATVYMACRDMKRCEEARQEVIAKTGNQKIYARQLDLASFESIRKFVDGFKKESNQLHILINNAGIMHCPRMLTKDGYEMQLGVNHMGHFLLTNLLLDVLKSSAPSRIVVVSSLAHLFGNINKDDLNSERSYNPRTAYGQSKLANILFTRELAKRLAGTKVTVNCLHPGAVDTDLPRHIAFFNNPIGRLILRPFLYVLMKTPKNGAQTSLHCALDPALENVSGLYFSDCKPKKPLKRATDDEMAKWLWKESEKWTKLESSKVE